MGLVMGAELRSFRVLGYQKSPNAFIKKIILCSNQDPNKVFQGIFPYTYTLSGLTDSDNRPFQQVSKLLHSRGKRTSLRKKSKRTPRRDKDRREEPRPTQGQRRGTTPSLNPKTLNP